jgi:hypothetical protein
MGIHGDAWGCIGMYGDVWGCKGKYWDVKEYMGMYGLKLTVAENSNT